MYVHAFTHTHTHVWRSVCAYATTKPNKEKHTYMDGDWNGFWCSAGDTRSTTSLSVLCVCWAGDNAFDYLIEGARVTAVDFNGAQIALTELKAAACR